MSLHLALSSARPTKARKLNNNGRADNLRNTACIVRYTNNDNDNDTDVNDNAPDRHMVWSAQVREAKQKILMEGILHARTHQHEHMTTLYAALARMDIFIGPDTLKAGLAFFGGEVLSRWREFKSDPYSSGDYKRDDFIATLKLTTDSVAAARQKDTARRARECALAAAAHGKDLFEMTKVCARFRLPVRKVAPGARANHWPIDCRNEWDTIVSARAIAGNPDLCEIKTLTPNRTWIIASRNLVQPNPYGRPIPGVLHLRNAQDKMPGNPEDTSLRMMPYDVIRGILWEQSKADLFQTALFHMRGPMHGRCILPAPIVNLILALHKEMIRDEVNVLILQRGYEYYPRMASGRRNWTLAQASEDQPGLHDFRDLEDELIDRRFMEDMQRTEMEFDSDEGELPPQAMRVAKRPRIQKKVSPARRPPAAAGVAIEVEDSEMAGPQGDDDDDDDD